MKIIIFDFNRTIYDPDSERLIEGAETVLSTLIKRGYKLVLISRQESRRDLIKKLGLEKFFDEIVVNEEKSRGDFEKTIAREEIEKEKGFVVGDRVREEITFGNLLGLQTIWLRAGKFAGEYPEKPEEEPDFTITRIEEILTIAL